MAIVLISACFYSPTAFACSCVIRSINEWDERSTEVFVGEIISSSSWVSPFSTLYRVKVTEIHKGIVGDVVFIWRNKGPCSSPLKLDRKFVFFATREILGYRSDSCRIFSLEDLRDSGFYGKQYEFYKNV